MKIECYIQMPLKFHDILPEFLSSWWNKSGPSEGKFKTSWSDHRDQGQGSSFSVRYLNMVWASVHWAVCYRVIKSGVQPVNGYFESYLILVTSFTILICGKWCIQWEREYCHLGTSFQTSVAWSLGLTFRCWF